MAFYAGALAEGATRRYAAYLASTCAGVLLCLNWSNLGTVGLDINLPRGDRDAALRQCEEHGLELADVARQTTEMLAKQLLDVSPGP